MNLYPTGPGVALAVLLAMASLAPAADAQPQGPNPESGAQMREANRNAGFDDGCATARSSRIAPVKQRDEAAYAASESYRSGWRQGYTMCKPSMDNTPERLLGDPLGRRW
jgi:hypothetical protein